jgi:hypothetical protein
LASHVTATAVVSDGNNAFVVIHIYVQDHAGPNVIPYHQPNHRLHMNPSTTHPTPQIKTKCATCTNESCKSFTRKTIPTIKPPMASIAAAVRCSSLQTLRTTALNQNLRHTDAVWPASLPRQRRPSKSSPLGNESPACSAKHTQSEECQDTSKPTTFLARRTISDG